MAYVRICECGREHWSKTGKCKRCRLNWTSENRPFSGRGYVGRSIRARAKWRKSKEIKQ